MGCTDWRNLRWILVLSALALAAGCASSGGKKEKKPAVAAEQAVDGDITAPIEPIPNPYLAQDVKAPTAVQTTFRNALVAMQSEDWSLAERQLLDLHQKHPELSGPLVNLGIIYWRQEKLAEAEKFFNQALAANALNNDAYIQFALFLRDQGRFAEAEAQYRKALEVWPHNAAAHRNLGILYDLYMGKFDEALKHYEMVLRLSRGPNKEVEGWIIDLKRRMAAG